MNLRSKRAPGTHQGGASASDMGPLVAQRLACAVDAAAQLAQTCHYIECARTAVVALEKSAFPQAAIRQSALARAVVFWADFSHLAVYEEPTAKAAFANGCVRCIPADISAAVETLANHPLP